MGCTAIETPVLLTSSCATFHYKLVDGFQEWAVSRNRDMIPNWLLRHYRKHHEVLVWNLSIRIRQDSLRELRV